MSAAYLVVVVLLVLAPGADFTLIVRNTLARGRAFGMATTLGVVAAAALQGFAASVGLATLIVSVRPLFLAIKWAGIVYLAWLAVSMLRSAFRGEEKGDVPETPQGARASIGFGQGFLCNILNPKVLVFYIALLAQFVPESSPWWVWLAYAWVHPLVTLAWSGLVVGAVGFLGAWFERRTVRRVFDGVCGGVLGGFAAVLALEN
ncbi:LysE family translocator [Actinomyces culturomici]|uniref:LysE family translocator n=1 Tax=Actinomyces culturomici TaxID=1926276 RepID=UPI0013573AE2|nr:LysE family translocator [Actinomyces culturomici]